MVLARKVQAKRRPMKTRGTRGVSAARSTALVKRAKPSGKIGRPLAKVDEVRVADLAYKGLSNRMIAVLVGVNDKTLARRFAAKLAFWRAERALHIHEMQWEILNGAAGPAGACKMAIWLGKNELGQSDKAAIEHSDALDIHIEVIMGPDDPPQLPDDPARYVNSRAVEQIGVSHDDSQER